MEIYRIRQNAHLLPFSMSILWNTLIGTDACSQILMIVQQIKIVIMAESLFSESYFTMCSILSVSQTVRKCLSFGFICTDGVATVLGKKSGFDGHITKNTSYFADHYCCNIIHLPLWNFLWNRGCWLQWIEWTHQRLFL